jgi:hypothetical protein
MDDKDIAALIGSPRRDSINRRAALVLAPSESALQLVIRSWEAGHGLSSRRRSDRLRVHRPHVLARQQEIRHVLDCERIAVPRSCHRRGPWLGAIGSRSRIGLGIATGTVQRIKDAMVSA